MRAGRMLIVMSLVGVACSQPAQEAAPDPALVAVAQDVCRVMWDWQLDMGGIMNAMSAASRLELDTTVRQSLYRDSFSQARSRNRVLADSIDALADGPFVHRLREDIRNGLFAADEIITQITTEVDSLHSAGTTGYREVVPHIFLGFEKVIDVAKPEMADYANPELTRAFISVPHCQHGVKDANDGQPRFIPRS